MFDRMIIKGHLMRLYHPGGVQAILWNQDVPLTEFAKWATTTTEALRQHAERHAAEAHRPCIYLEKRPPRTPAGPRKTSRDRSRHATGSPRVLSASCGRLSPAAPSSSSPSARWHPDVHAAEVDREGIPLVVGGWYPVGGGSL
jgi:hypothetical protein